MVPFALFGELFSRLVLLFCCMASGLREFLMFGFMRRSYYILQLYR